MSLIFVLILKFVGNDDALELSVRANIDGGFHDFHGEEFAIRDVLGGSLHSLVAGVVILQSELDFFAIFVEGEHVAIFDVADFVNRLLGVECPEDNVARVDFVVLLVGEDVNASDVALGVAVLSGLGSLHFGDLARETLEHDVSALLDVVGFVGMRVTHGCLKYKV